MASVLAVGRAGYFYPRSPYGERLETICCWRCNGYFYPRSPYGERPCSLRYWSRAIDFYPRSPYGERQLANVRNRPTTKFLSTLSLRRATIVILRKTNTPSKFLSTLSLRRATHFPCTELYQQRYFYPRSPYGERHGRLSILPIDTAFLSTLSLRRATGHPSHIP